jgi:hypothetical protein
MDWVDRLAEALGEETLTAQEIQRLLAVARDVAHRVERKATPLAAYIVGIAVGARMAEGASREAAFDDAIEAVYDRLPPGAPDEEPGEG